MSLIRQKKRVILPGPILIGFGDLFDRSYGDPRTPRPYPKVTPSRIGSVLLPFPCPHCDEVRPQVVDVKTRLGWWDKGRDFSWCPSCRKRFIVEPQGMELKKALPPGATHAPALIERGKGRTELVGLAKPDGLNVLGVEV
jgi:hypothetical protein